MLAFGEECLSDAIGTSQLTLYEVRAELATYHRQSGAGNYSYFGGEAAFAEMVRKAEQLGKDPASI
jgi:hypothetical protein